MKKYFKKILMMHTSVTHANSDFKSKYAPPDSDAFKRVIDAIGNEQEYDKSNYEPKYTDVKFIKTREAN